MLNYAIHVKRTNTAGTFNNSVTKKAAYHDFKSINNKIVG